MIRMKPVKDVKKAEAYYAKSDGGYYVGEGGMHCEWGGKAAGELGLTGPPEFEQFSRLLRGLDPNSGEKLTAKLVKGRIAGWDVTASVPKGVTTALEQGDDRIRRPPLASQPAGDGRPGRLRHDAGAGGWQAGGSRYRQSRLVLNRACRNAAGRG